MMVGQEMMIIIKLLFPLIIRNNGLNDALTMINDNTSSRPVQLYTRPHDQGTSHTIIHINSKACSPTSACESELGHVN